MEFIITLAVLGFIGWVGWEIYKVKFAGNKKKQPDPYSYLKAPDQGLQEPLQPHTAHYHGTPVAPPVSLKHEIVAHGFHKAYNGSLWPEWTCKCGGSNAVPTHTLQNLEQAKREAHREAASHVSDGNKAEELLSKTNGKFAW